MKTAFGILTAGLLATGLLVSMPGCELTSCEDEDAPADTSDAGEGSEETTGNESDEDNEGCIRFESLKKFVGTSETKQVGWNDGGKLRIESRNGRVTVKAGSGDTFDVEFTPFSWRGHSKKDQAIAEIENKLNKVADGDGSGGALVKTSRKSGSSSGLGADIVVTLPAGFNGAIEIEQDNGFIDVQSVGSATSLNVENTGAGDCEINGNSTVTSTTVNCDFDIEVYNVADSVNVHAKGLGDVTVSIASANAGGGNITADKGDVALTMPASGTYSVQATANAEGTVNEGSVPSGCMTQEAAANSKTVSCGAGGPNYVVSAGADSSFAKDVTLGYQ